ncbi:class 1 fructose-bisphosphatase [Stappia sp. F7233]|uniref:Fructose-1,6-bisphosphatase class 1 n=1 Tax=Stappia albiluteola TaxID=2758565 RepID=A0A839A824_9HYPH|nr:class 1 fructose-bisphosphatase [Stappia albiluteola]MBA5775673.1 class 1 fructose-bisphosphatase [Stappia albiluteola]
MRTLEAFLKASEDGSSARRHVTEAIGQFALAAIKVRDAINEGALGDAFASTLGPSHEAGDEQKELDVFADEAFLAAAKEAGIAYYASEELEHPIEVDPAAEIAIAIDPLDGSSNIDTNASIGTIFSILPSVGGERETFCQAGSRQLAAGFFIYGPQLALALTLGNGTHIFVYSRRRGVFIEAYADLKVPSETREFAINISNFRHWGAHLQAYVEDCLAGATGPRAKDFNMRWLASLVADAYRILIRGGVFLYPSDSRKGYADGRLRLVYEASPIAFLIEQAGGAAINGEVRVLDLTPESLHQRTAFIFGSAGEVTRVEGYFARPATHSDAPSILAPSLKGA